MAYTFTEAQKSDIRRFCGYDALGAAPDSFIGYRYFTKYALIEYRMLWLSESEGEIVANMLIDLNNLEQQYVNVGITGLLNTEKAGPFIRNRSERLERRQLYYDRRMELINFFGAVPGPHFNNSRGIRTYS